MSCPANGQMLDATDKPECVSPKAQEQLEKKEKIDFDVEITDAGVVLDEDILSSDRWKDFADGKHTATLKEDQLIIRKTGD